LGDIRSELENIQSDLFHIGAWLATSPGAPAADLLAAAGFCESIGARTVHRPLR